MRETLRMWGYAAARLLAVLAVGLLVGLIVGRPFAGLFIALLIYVATQLRNLLRLDLWLRHRSLMQPPVMSGVWDDIVTQIVRIYRRKRVHKQSLVTILRELRDSTAAMPDGVVVLNSLGEITWFNRMATQLLGLRRRQDLGLRIENLLRQPEFVRYLQSGHYAAPVIVQTNASPETWLSFHVLPYGAGQRLLLVRDVTRSTRLESMRKDFVANASHELRSPLTVISGYLETLAADEEVDPALRPPLEEMRRQAERMTAIIDDLLVLSRLESKEGEADGEPVDVGALLAVLRKDILARPRHPATVELQLDSDALLVGDEGELHSAFSNLVDNAAKYTPVEGRVSIRWWADEDGGHVAVADTGPGIASDLIPRLTERFYRVDPGRSRATGGSGLGLSIVKHALQRHGATLAITSTEGRGSTFTCHFPPRRVLARAERSRQA